MMATFLRLVIAARNISTGNFLMKARLSHVVCLAALLSAGHVAPAAADADAEQLIKGLDAVFGKHEGIRTAHTVGTCVKGSFQPSAEAASLSKAPQFNSKNAIPVVGRFSMGGGDPKASNAAKDNVRGLALHFDIGNGATTDLVLISAPVFLAKSPDQFLALLTTVATGDKTKIDQFFKDNPNATVQGSYLAGKPVPASYATVDYWGVHAFTATNAEGKKTVFKYKAIPAGGEVGLSDEEAAKKAPDFYVPELKERLAKGPADFKLTAILGEPGDPTDDPSALWPEDTRKSIDLGTISITALENDATCDAGIFDPNNLADGVEAPANDTVLPMRSQAYGVSFSRRQK